MQWRIQINGKDACDPIQCTEYNINELIRFFGRKSTYVVNDTVVEIRHPFDRGQAIIATLEEGA